jgi:hypothetical protein
VGHFCCQLAADAGAKVRTPANSTTCAPHPLLTWVMVPVQVIGVASSKNHDFMRSLGAHHTIEYKDDIAARVKQIVPEGEKNLSEWYISNASDAWEPDILIPCTGIGRGRRTVRCVRGRFPACLTAGGQERGGGGVDRGAALAQGGTSGRSQVRNAYSISCILLCLPDASVGWLCGAASRPDLVAMMNA